MCFACEERYKVVANYDYIKIHDYFIYFFRTQTWIDKQRRQGFSEQYLPYGIITDSISLTTHTPMCQSLSRLLFMFFFLLFFVKCSVVVILFPIY